MKKILFIIENYRIGGIQKSLINMLNSISGFYDIDVAAFDPNGEYKKKLPDNIHLIEMPDHFKAFARPENDLKHTMLWYYRLLFCFIAKVIDKGKALKILSPIYKIKKHYDVAISFSHSGYYKSANGICPEFVLQKTKAQEKICFIHCDYEHSGFKCLYNNKLYRTFDKIACCSDSVRAVFLESNSGIEYKTYTVRNFFDLDLLHIRKDELDLPIEKIHMFSIARLSQEKGISRAIEALYRSKRSDIDYYIVGDGPIKKQINNMISDYHMDNQVYLYGSLPNPYPLLLNADYLLVPSLNEAAPMVFDEAKVLGITIIATETISAREMLDSGDIICDNSIEGLCETFRSLNKEKSNKTKKAEFNNKAQMKQFQLLINNLAYSK